MQILQRNDFSAQAVAAMGSQFVVESGMVPLEHSHSQPQVLRPTVHRMPPPRVIRVPDATVLLNEDAMVEAGGDVPPRLMPLKVVPQGNGSAQALRTEVLDANLVAYEDFAGLLGEQRSASGAFSDSSVAASEKSDPSYRTSATPVDSSSRRVKFMCSFGGKILPRPSDGKLRYVGGETRILSVGRHITYADLLLKLSETYGQSLSLKYQLPDEDIDSLISVCSDEDLENMMEEFDRLDAGESSSKLRVFLFSAANHDPLHLSDTADRRNSEQKYVDAVNSVGGMCLGNNALFNSSHDLIGLDLSDVKISGLPEPETLLTPVTTTEIDLQTVAVGMPVPPKLYSGKTLMLSGIPNSSFVAPQPSPVNYQYVTLKKELSHQDLELADSASSSAASHPDLFYQFPGMLEADSLGRMVHIDSHSRMGQIHSSGGVFSSQEQQKELTTHPGATNMTLDDPSPGNPIPRMDFHQSHLQAQPQTDFIQTSWQHPADEHLSRPTSSVSGNVQKLALQQEQQASTVSTPAAHEAMFYKHMDQQQQQEEVLAGLLPSQVASGPIFQMGPPSSPHIGLVENMNKFGNMQHMQGYLALNGGLVDEEHGEILYHKNRVTGRVFQPLNSYVAHVEPAVPTEEQAACQLPVINIENRQKQFFNLAHDKYEPSHVLSKPTASPYLVVGSHYDGFRHFQDGTFEDQILLEEQQSHSFLPNSADRQPFFCYVNDRQGNMDQAVQHRESDTHEAKLCTGLQSHVEYMDLKEKESVASLAFNSYLDFPSANFPAPNLPEESTSLPDFAANSVGHDPIESTPFYLRAALYPKGDAEQALVFDPVVVSKGLHTAQLNRRPEMDSLLVHTNTNTVTLALDVLKDSSISIPASNDSTCVPTSQRSFVASNDNSNVSKGQRSSAEKLPDSKLSQLPLQISSLVAGTGLNASESFFSAENETQLTEGFHFNAAEAEVRQQSALRRGPANEESSKYKSSLHGNASNRMDPSEGLPLHHSTNTKSLIDDASEVCPYSDHHSSNSGVGTSVSYSELLATLANGVDSSLVNAAIAASPATSFLPEAVTTYNASSPSVDLLRVSTHSQPSINFMVAGAQDQGKEGANFALESEFCGLNYTALDVPKNLENTDRLSSLTSSSKEQYNHVKDQSSSFAQLHIHNLESEPKRSSSEHTRESASAAFIQPTLYSAPTLSIQNWEKSLTEAEIQEQDVAADLSEERLSETVKTHAIREKEVIFEEIKMGVDEEDMHEYKIHQPNNLAAIAEAEAISRGLQIIKNADLEELRELGAGTFGTVYHGKWRGTDVAIKRIKSSCFTGRPSERERLIADFWREACILSQLHHPNVVAFYGIVPDGPGATLATVTEFMVNGSLKQVLQRKDRTIDRRKRLLIAMDAAFGMEYLHGKNIVHFDLKCENLLVNMRDPQRPICKVGDLGLSKIKHQTLVSGGVRGTLPWMAPELLNGSSSLVSEKVDVFSFGIVMWELLTGEEPYANMHYGAIIGGIVNNTLRPSVPNWCDPAWKLLMERCWSSEPNERPSFPDIARELRAMAASLHARGQTQAHTAG